MPNNYTIINFCNQPDELTNLISRHNISNKNVRVIDINGSLSEVNGLLIYKPMTEDQGFEILQKSHALLAQKIGELAQELGRFNIDGLSIFWQTNMAEKHDYYSVFGKITYFELLLDLNIKLFALIENSEKIYFVLPVNSSIQTHKLVRQLIKKSNKRAIIESNYSWIRLLKRGLISNAVFLKKTIKTLTIIRSDKRNFNNRDSEQVLASYIFLTRGKTNNKHKPEYILTERLGKKIEMIDLSEDVKDNFCQNKVYSSNQMINRQVVAATPSKKQVLIILKKVLLLKMIFFFKGIYNRTSDFHFNACAMIEMSRTLMAFDTLFLYTWYKNYFSKVRDKKLFLITDEFYKMGRLICNAKNNSQNRNIKIIGIQHGMIGEAHTVYKITDDELKGKHPLPIPDHFIVWGEFFSTFFKKFNKLPPYFTKVASYLEFEDSCLITDNSEKKRLLWCTTLPEIALFDFNLLENLPNFANFQIVLRQHPNFNITKYIEGKINQNNELWNRIILDKSPTINDAIQSADIVLAPSPSTVILNSLLNKTPILYTDCGYRICDFKDDFNAGIYVVRNSKEFNEKFKRAINQKPLSDNRALSKYLDESTSIAQTLIDILDY
ncbi:hypothetical protein [Gelidibacter japonicus]|uniref:hypothetical protein n=1 Tax=Gelidibacter japonicus TaxID=1962232 RepID=UPI003A948EF7